MASREQSFFVYINGYPGVGKLTVTRALQAIMDDTKVFDNHKLIDVTAAIFERNMPEYRPHRQQMRRLVLNSIATSETLKDTSWIFTDSQSSDPIGSSAAKDYEDAAILKNAKFFSIILQCDEDENVRRLVGGSRGGSDNTKLTDVDMLSHIRATEDIHRFGGELELVVDVTSRSPESVAGEIKNFVTSHTDP